MDIRTWTLAEAIRKVKSGEADRRALLKASLDAIKADGASEKPLNAVVGTHEDLAEAQLQKKDPSDTPLAGVPVLHKDNLVFEGFPVTCGSKILEGYKAPYRGTALGRLADAGAVFYARANMDEFAMGSTSETSAYGPVRNPVHRDHVPGGSSGGSAAAVAGGLAIAALGSDTGGSIRQPAAFCGLVGLKPTYGRVSRYGLVAYGSSLDAVGPITKTVEDAAILLGHMAGVDPLDSTSSDESVPDYVAGLEKPLAGLRIGLPKEYFSKDLDPVVRAQIDRALSFYEKSGCKLVEVSLPHSSYAVGTYYVIATAEASSNLARFDGIRYGRRAKEATSLKETYLRSRTEGFGLEVKRRILLGTYVLSSGYYDAYYVKAQKVRRVIQNDFRDAFRAVDLIAAPVSPEPVPRIGAKSDDPVKMYLSDIYTISPNLAGLPAIALPCGADGAGLPVGFQLVGPWFAEERLLAAAHAWDKVRGN